VNETEEVMDVEPAPTCTDCGGPLDEESLDAYRQVVPEADPDKLRCFSCLARWVVEHDTDA
jgi:hypothetical protein